MSELGQQLWSALDRIRGSYDVGSYAELVLGLLYLRVREPELWQWLLRESSGDVVHGLLVRAELPANPHVPRVSLFRTVTQTSDDDRSLIEMVHTINQIDLSGSGDATSAVAPRHGRRGRARSGARCPLLPRSPLPQKPAASPAVCRAD